MFGYMADISVIIVVQSGRTLIPILLIHGCGLQRTRTIDLKIILYSSSLIFYSRTENAEALERQAGVLPEF